LSLYGWAGSVVSVACLTYVADLNPDFPSIRSLRPSHARLLANYAALVGVPALPLLIILRVGEMLAGIALGS
jgi:hypothetical protein